MQKIIRNVDEKRGICQVTTADERYYLKPSIDPVTKLPVYLPVPSVTWIVDYWPNKFLEQWRAEKGIDEAEAIKKAGGEKGSAVHNALDMIIQGKEFRIDTKVIDRIKSTEQEPAMRELTYDELLCVQSFIDWHTETERDYTIETIVNETVIFSEIHGYAGTVDWVVRLTPKAEGKNPLDLGAPTLFVIDFKTSQQIGRAYEMQVSAYRVALENGENHLYERNPNGTETNELVDVSGMRTAILQVGYRYNKAGYKFTVIDDAFGQFKIAQSIWKEEHTSKKNGETLTPGYTQRDFPIVLSAGRQDDAVDATVDEAIAASELPAKKANKAA